MSNVRHFTVGCSRVGEQEMPFRIESLFLCIVTKAQRMYLLQPRRVLGKYTFILLATEIQRHTIKNM